MTYSKVIDALAFLTFGAFALYHFQLYRATMVDYHGHLFELTTAIAVIYTMLRKRDVNTVTLGLIVLTTYLVGNMPFFSSMSTSGFSVYLVFFIFNCFAVVLIWLRPLLFSRITPWWRTQDMRITRQDRYMWVTYALNGVFMLAMFIEHGLRKIDDSWHEHARFLYDRFELIQLIFLMVGLLIFYYMTFDASKEQPKVD